MAVNSLQQEPYRQMFAITPSDSQTLKQQGLPQLRALYVTVAGNLNYSLQRDAAPTTIPVTAGQTLRVYPKQIMSTGTTATVAGLN